MSKSVRRASVNLTPRKPHLVDHFSGRCRTCRMDAGEEGGGPRHLTDEHSGRVGGG